MKLRHPGFAHLIDFVRDETSGVMALVTELVPGPTLREVLRAGPIPARDAVQISVQLVDALEYIHVMGLCRLDLKPANIVLRGLSPVIVDLSIVKPAPGSIQSDETSQFITAVGVLVGTPRYLAPEQLLRTTGDIRSDIYTLGLLLYEMIDGQLPELHPFNEASLPTRFEAPLHLSGIVSPQLHAVILKALAPDPKDRYSDPRQLLQALKDVPEANVSISRSA